MPTDMQLRAWSTAVRAPMVALIVTTLLLIALAIAMGVEPAQMYADPAPLSVM